MSQSNFLNPHFRIGEARTTGVEVRHKINVREWAREEYCAVTDGVTFRTEGSADRAAVLRLRDAVYVQDQSRLARADDMTDSFDLFDRQAVYLLAVADSTEVGTIKMIPDSAIGLPCDSVADVSPFRSDGRLVEFGHLLTVPAVRGRSIGMSLMRHALVYSVTRLHATHIVGDFFVDDTGGLRPFYRDIGFVPINEPYADDRFQGAPLSLVAVIDLAASAARAAGASGRQATLLRYFFHDYEALVAGRTVR